MEKEKEQLRPKIVITKTKKISQIQKKTLYQNLLESTNIKSSKRILDTIAELVLTQDLSTFIQLSLSTEISLLRLLKKQAEL